jgi:hypothetical protein
MLWQTVFRGPDGGYGVAEEPPSSDGPGAGYERQDLVAVVGLSIMER